MTIASSPKKLKLEPTFTPLPDHLIEENILIRLPVTPLIRLACVSKGWSSMISSTKFTKEHLKQWYPSNNRSLIVQDDRDTEGEDKYYLSFDENYNLNEFVELRNKYPTYLFKPLKTCVVGSCNGLLCMLNEETMRIYVWNPMTNVVRDTMGPAPHFCRSEDYEVRCVGFGYVSSIDEYKIGCLMFYKKTLLSLVFSLKTGRWAKRRQRKKHYKKVLACIDRETPVFVNDTIYWISDIIEDGHSFLIGLDLVYDDMIFLKTFVNIPQGFANAKLFRMQGCLALCIIQNGDGDGDGRVLQVCKMIENDDEEDDRFIWNEVFDLNYIGKNFVYLFDTGKFLVNKISHQSQQLMLHELKVSSLEEEEGEGEGEGEGEEQEEAEEEEEGEEVEEGEEQEEVEEEEEGEEVEEGEEQEEAEEEEEGEEVEEGEEQEHEEVEEEAREEEEEEEEGEEQEQEEAEEEEEAGEEEEVEEQEQEEIEEQEQEEVGEEAEEEEQEQEEIEEQEQEEAEEEAGEEEEEEEQEQEEGEEQEQGQEEEGEDEQEQNLEPIDEGTVVWESVDRGSLFRYFSGAAFGYSESLISPFYSGLLGKDEDQIVDVID